MIIMSGIAGGGHLLMFACGKVIKLEWSIHGQRGGSTAHGIDKPGCSPASNRDIIKTAISAVLSSRPWFPGEIALN